MLETSMLTTQLDIIRKQIELLNLKILRMTLDKDSTGITRGIVEKYMNIIDFTQFIDYNIVNYANAYILSLPEDASTLQIHDKQPQCVSIKLYSTIDFHTIVSMFFINKICSNKPHHFYKYPTVTFRGSTVNLYRTLKQLKLDIRTLTNRINRDEDTIESLHELLETKRLDAVIARVINDNKLRKHYRISCNIKHHQQRCYNIARSYCETSQLSSNAYNSNLLDDVDESDDSTKVNFGDAIDSSFNCEEDAVF